MLSWGYAQTGARVHTDNVLWKEGGMKVFCTRLIVIVVTNIH